jgi:serine/threonine protein kinase
MIVIKGRQKTIEKQKGRQIVSKAGEKYGQHILQSLISSDGFSETWLGTHERDGSKATIQVLNLSLSTAEEQTKFFDEADWLRSLQHPNIVRILARGLQGETPYLVMEYTPNGTLRTKYPRGTQLPSPLVVQYVKQIAGALQYAHDQRLIHRNVKPENMLLGEHDQILVSDFGIATVEKTTSFRVTQQQLREVPGTAGYMAPEQFDGNLTTASDQYALGVVVYEWLCGSLPFSGDGTEVRIQQKQKVPALRDRVQGISPELERVVLKAMSENLHQRYRDMQAFADALEQAVMASGTSASHIQASPLQINTHPKRSGGGGIDPNILWRTKPSVASNNAVPSASYPIPVLPISDPAPAALNPVIEPHQFQSSPHLPPLAADESPASMLTTPVIQPLELRQTLYIHHSEPQLAANIPSSSTGPFVQPEGVLNPSYQASNPGAVLNHIVATVNSNRPENALPGVGPFSTSPFISPTPTMKRRAVNRSKLFVWRGVFMTRNYLFIFGGGLIDFLLAVAMAVGFHKGNASWNLWLASFVLSWVARAFCTASVRKVTALPLAILLSLYWGGAIWLVGSFFHLALIPPYIIALLLGAGGLAFHVLYAEKKR